MRPDGPQGGRDEVLAAIIGPVALAPATTRQPSQGSFREGRSATSVDDVSAARPPQRRRELAQAATERLRIIPALLELIHTAAQFAELHDHVARRPGVLGQPSY